MTLPLGFLIFLMVLGALVAFGGICSAYWLICWWWRDLMWARTLRRWTAWGGPEAYDYFVDRISDRAARALDLAKEKHPQDRRAQAMAVATAVHAFMTRTEPRTKQESTVEEQT